MNSANTKTIVVFTDGASRGNPGQAAIGVVSYKVDGKAKTELFSLSKYIGRQTNNFAEYTAAILALRELIKLGLNKEAVVLCADSKLLIEQINGSWKVKNENIKPLYEDLQKLKNKFSNIKFQYVPREKNKVADALANEALDNLK